jgi:hypothetical protein
VNPHDQILTIQIVNINTNQHSFKKTSIVMQKITHRMANLAVIAIVTAAMAGFYACDKNSDSAPPTLHLLGTDGAITADASAAMGDTLHFHLRAKAGSDKLLTLQVRINGSTVKDSTYSSIGFELHQYLIKGADSLEVIEFIVRDYKSREARISVKVTLKGGVSWGPVVRYDDIELGAQDHASIGSFYAISGNQVMDLASAFSNQGLVDLIYYFEAGDANTIASPGANLTASLFTGPYALSQWTTLRTTRYKKVNLTAPDFQQCSNDSLLIASYGTGDGNRKAKNLAAGHYYSFMTEDNKAGLFYVKSIIGQSAGTIIIDLITQQ